MREFENVKIFFRKSLRFFFNAKCKILVLFILFIMQLSQNVSICWGNNFYDKNTF
jgi:hypothetical protein